MGYSDRSGARLPRLLASCGFSAAKMEQSGLGMVASARTAAPPMFSQPPLEVPIANEAGKTIASAGRALSPRANQYLNSPETTIYKKSHCSTSDSAEKEAVRKEEGHSGKRTWTRRLSAQRGGLGAWVASADGSDEATGIHAAAPHQTDSREFRSRSAGRECVGAVISLLPRREALPVRD